MEKAVIFDIDGVLAEKSLDRDYREYDKVELDKPIPQGFELLNFYSQFAGYKIIFITGRKQCSLEKTMQWLKTYSPVKFRLLIELDRLNINLFMRGDADHRPAKILKKEIYDNHIKGKYDVVAVFEDDKENCRMWKREGLFVFQVGTRDDFCL